MIKSIFLFVAFLTLTVSFCTEANANLVVSKKTKSTAEKTAVDSKSSATKPEKKTIEIFGKVYERGTDKTKPIYKYERKIWEDGDHSKAIAKYTDLEGKVLYEENYTFKGTQILSYNYDQKQVGDLGVAEFNGSKISMKFTEEGKTKTKELEDKGILILPMLIASVLHEHWDQILAGDSVDTRYPLVERLDTVGFSFKKKKELTYNGIEAIQIQMKPTSFIIASIVDPIMMIYEKNGECRLLESDGRLPIRISKWGGVPQKRGDWKAMDGILVLDYGK